MIYLIVALAIAARFIPGTENFSPVYAALLFGGAYLKRRDSIWFPILLLAASDLMLNAFVYQESFSWAQSLNWVAFAAIIVVGWSLRNRVSVRNVTAAAIGGSLAFFVISNFAAWLAMPIYPPTLGGLEACFAAGIPFYGTSVISAVLFSGILFGAYEFYRRRELARQLASR